LSYYKPTKYETNQDTKPKTEYLKSGTIERYKTAKFTKNIKNNAYENKNKRLNWHGIYKSRKNDLPSSKYVPFLHPLALNNNLEMII